MRRGSTVCGAVSLTVIFCVLCMAVFAALTFVTANRERVLSELDAQRAAEFYRADREATRIAAALRSGEIARDADGAAVIRDAENADADNEREFLIIDDNQPDILIIEDEDDGELPEIRYTPTDAGTLAEFSLPAGGEQRLDVRLLLRGGDMDILAWKKVYAGDWQNDDNLTLADIGDIITLAEIN